ncbi:hypothetical protein [Salipiger marinus]|uniref:hypothetical protein n=1 Tax=Salipiger marinus TaxID=555512 RepID=UPI00405897B1
MTTTEHTSGASDEARRLRDDAARKAQSLQADATEQVRDRAEHVKDSVAEDVSSVGDALRTASGELRKGSPQAQIFGSLAEQLAGFSDALRGRDVTEIVGEVSAFGRRNPAAFLGGAALLGFAAVRMVRASAPEATSEAIGSAPMDRPAPSDPLATPAVQSTPATPEMTPPVTPPQEDR